MSWDNNNTLYSSWDATPKGSSGDCGTDLMDPAGEWHTGDNDHDQHGGNEHGEACFSCGETGKADYPNPRTDGSTHQACFNCGETGHRKADCPNPRAESQEFTGQCNLCQREGHRARDCPEKPAIICRNCETEGHVASECKEPQRIDRSHIESVDAEVAWNRIKEASKNKDLDSAKLAVQQYIKACPDTTYVALEKAFRNQDMGLFLIAVEKTNMIATLTLMDFQGVCDKKYTVTYRLSDKPARPRERALFPKSQDENIERLGDAGEPVDSGKRKCNNCQTLGHSAKDCPEIKVEKEQVSIKCLNCEAIGHRIRDCPEERVDRFSRQRHPGNAEDVDCRKCGEVGHFARDCPQGGQGGGSRDCFKCGEAGHIARDCPNQADVNMSNDNTMATGGFDEQGPMDDFANNNGDHFATEDSLKAATWESAASGAGDSAWTTVPSAAAAW